MLNDKLQCTDYKCIIVAYMSHAKHRAAAAACTDVYVGYLGMSLATTVSRYTRKCIMNTVLSHLVPFFE